MRPISAQYILRHQLFASERSVFHAFATGTYDRPHHPHARGLVRTHKGQPIALLLSVFSAEPPGLLKSRGKYYTFLPWMRVGVYVKPAFRGRGLGHALCHQFSNWLLEQPVADGHDFGIITAQYNIHPWFEPMRQHSRWILSPSPHGHNIWETQLREHFRWRTIPPPRVNARLKALNRLLHAGYRPHPEKPSIFHPTREKWPLSIHPQVWARLQQTGKPGYHLLCSPLPTSAGG